MSRSNGQSCRGKDFDGKQEKSDPTTYIQYMWVKYHRYDATRKVSALNKVSHTLCANEQLYTDNEKEIKL